MPGPDAGKTSTASGAAATMCPPRRPGAHIRTSRIIWARRMRVLEVLHATTGVRFQRRHLPSGSSRPIRAVEGPQAKQDERRLPSVHLLARVEWHGKH